MTTERDPVVRLHRVAKAYGGTKVLLDVTLSLHRGEFVALIGESGAGKSTLMNIAGLLDRPTSGSVEFEGFDYGSAPDRERRLYRAKAISFVFQAFHLVPHLTSLENVSLGLRYAGFDTNGRREAAAEALRQVGLGHRLHVHPETLSGGEMQRVAIARATARRPRLVLADEPTGNLDRANGDRVMRILGDLARRGRAGVLIVTHDESLARMADRVVRVRGGRILEGPE